MYERGIMALSVEYPSLQHGVEKLQQVVEGPDRAELAGRGGLAKVTLGVVDRVILAVDGPADMVAAEQPLRHAGHHPAEATLELADEIGITRGEPPDQGGLVFA